MEQVQEIAEKGAEIKAIETVASLFSPEAIIMLSVAFFVDVGEALIELIPGIGQILSIIIDIFALIFFGFWMWFRSGIVTTPSKTGKTLTKATAKVAKWSKRLKWLRPLCFLIELLPIASSILPLWILVVYLELKHNT